ncbi:NAD(P)H-binding protein [Lentilactobacillus hilgardii]|jgi:uncharacterized protein YbjT (DUF2867 family)|uniref:NAD(P)H-binding protein n=1 Tax=Lentilactobacillus hilgardii TaxID=1588 RepID=A0A6P1EC18_LENHI|nr:NAD(P)H-binding protein [Lentilactobacillus hilgardii]EEI70783.1 TrkA N-terminal domain protein [Lentilactobacillus hilgardii ATCC 27305]MCT3390528.1 NAD-dependent epimerase/dehydratase family protein [Lentilactobacillus hilgardii]QHB52781.1 NAD(P)H-binding protein [Lentilactobacillus hilgardii]RRG12670.1 MAG: NAD-dependent epimerase/dehydratase family protein [Lactobacillus sp.]
MKITLLGSLGHIGSIVAPALLKDGHDVTIITTSQKRAAQIKELGANAAIGTMTDEDFLSRQFQNADVVYLMISGNSDGSIFENAKKQGQIFSNAVRKANVKNVVDLSSIGAYEPEAGSLYAYHFIEDKLRELNDVNVAFVRPVGFYSNLYTNVQSIRQNHVIYSNIPEQTEGKRVSPIDIAKVVLKLLEQTPEGKTIHYVYSDTFSMHQLIEMLKVSLPMPDLHFVQITDQEAENQLLSNGIPMSIAKSFVQMNAFQRNPEKLYEDLNRQSPVAGHYKLTDFVQEFTASFNDQKPSGGSNTLVDK